MRRKAARGHRRYVRTRCAARGFTIVLLGISGLAGCGGSSPYRTQCTHMADTVMLIRGETRAKFIARCEADHGRNPY